MYICTYMYSLSESFLLPSSDLRGGRTDCDTKSTSTAAKNKGVVFFQTRATHAQTEVRLDFFIHYTVSMIQFKRSIIHESFYNKNGKKKKKIKNKN